MASLSFRSLEGNLDFPPVAWVGFSASPGDDEAGHRLCPGKGKNLRGAKPVFSSVQRHTYGGWRFSIFVILNKNGLM